MLWKSSTPLFEFRISPSDVLPPPADDGVLRSNIDACK